MITFYTAGAPSVALSDNALCSELTRTAGWIDVFEPTREEEEALELALGINVPTRQEMQAIELSSRLYQEDGILFLTATVLTGATTSNP